MADELVKQEAAITTESDINYDKQFRKILDELKEGKDDKDRGAPIALSSGIFRNLLALLQRGLTREEAYRASDIGKTTFYSYMSKSETFKNAIEIAEDLPNTSAITAITGTFVGVKNPDVENSKWWLERVQKHRFSKSPEVVNNNNNNMAIIPMQKEALAKGLLAKYAKSIQRTTK